MRKPEVIERLAVRRLDLVDEKNEIKATLLIKDNLPEFSLMGGTQRVDIGFGVDKEHPEIDGAFIAINDTKRNARITLLTAGDTALLEIADRKGEAAIVLELDDDGTRKLKFLDTAGKKRAEIFLHVGWPGQIAFFDTAGIQVAQWPPMKELLDREKANARGALKTKGHDRPSKPR